MNIKFIDLFAGIGGIRKGLEQAIIKAGSNPVCVFTSEIKPYAISILKQNHPNEDIIGDITKVDASTIPDFDILCAGFPCQAFSLAGKRMGFNETRGTLFFDVAEILRRKRPKAFFLENVKGLAHCGRLDIDTEGLLLITDDGDLIHRLLSPKKHVDKVYEVHIRQALLPADIERLEKGVNIGDKKDDGSIDYTLPAKVELCDDKDEDGYPVIFLTIHEGRFHQVKRMLEAVGNEVMFLRRISMGSLVLDEELGVGEYRALTEDEINELKK